MTVTVWQKRFLAVLSMLIALAVFGACGSDFTSSPSTVVYLVRHAEKAEGGKDPNLSPAGNTRAEMLADTLGDADVAAIYVTKYRRTQQTGAPLAKRLGLNLIEYAARDSAQLAKHILATHRGERVLVVGHSNTVDDIAAALGNAEIAELQEHHYDRLFIIHSRRGQTELESLRYGAPTP